MRVQRVVVIGSGESGLWAARLLKVKKYTVFCSTADEIPYAIQKEFKNSGILYEEGHHARFIQNADLMVTSPGVRPSSLPLRLARKHRIPVISELQLAANEITGPWIAVTGTSGKTTTASLLYQMIRRERPVDLCGNIGASLSRSILMKPIGITRVVEASSFQLRYSRHFRPDVAVVLNLSPNHLDWHPTLSDYYASKLNIIRGFKRSAKVILNRQDPELMRRTRHVADVRKLYFGSGHRRGVCLEESRIYSVKGKDRNLLAHLNRCRLRGAHNQSNVMAAALAAQSLGITAESIQKGIDSFHPLEHRLEYIGSLNGVIFINDSKATTVSSTKAALESFEGPTVLIAGGKAKEREFDKLTDLFQKKISHLVLYGQAAPVIARALSGFRSKTVVSRFSDAVNLAYQKAGRQGTVLLSPMCSSFDQFPSYEARGEAFKHIYQSLKRDT